jgi:outer membrane protein TolC
MNNPNYRELREQLDKARIELIQARSKYERKKKQLVKTVSNHTPDLFGEVKAKQENTLFDAPIDPGAIPSVLIPFQLDIDNAQAECSRIEKLLLRIESINIPDLFQQTA